jgi:hypothetical protein
MKKLYMNLSYTNVYNFHIKWNNNTYNQNIRLTGVIFNLTDVKHPHV